MNAPATPPRVLTAAESDPVALGWMQGHPPPPDKLVRVSDLSHFAFPRTRWSFAHMRELLPTTRIARAEGPPSELPAAPRDDIDAVRFLPIGSQTPMTWLESLDANYTDAILVMHRGRVVYERYRGVMNPAQVHMAMSVTKSYTGTLAEMLVHEGALDPAMRVPALIPELAGTAYDTATVRDVMDMRIGVRYSENYADPAAEIWLHARAGGLFPPAPDGSGAIGFYGFLKTLRQEGPHGADFAYKTVSTDVLGWMIRRVTGQRFGQVLSQRLWQPLGCEHDAAMVVDHEGTEFAGGGLNPTLRDMARFGEAMRCDGALGGRQVIPAAVVHAIRTQGVAEAFRANGPATLAGGAYRSMWWLHHDTSGTYSARGVHGQAIVVIPKQEVVIARFGSHPLAANIHFDPTSLPAYAAVAQHLAQG